MKKLVVLLLAFAMVFAMAACGGGGGTAEPAAPPAEEPAVTETEGPTAVVAEEEFKIGYIITFASHEWYANQVKGAEMTAEEMGLDFILADAKNDQDTQITVGQNLLAQGVDVLIMAPADAQGAVPLIEEAMNQGVFVVTTSVLAPIQDVYVGCHDREGGQLLGQKAAEYVIANDLPTPKVLLVGLPALQACIDRSEGFKEGMLPLIPDATFIDVDGGGSKDSAMPAASDALTGNPDVNMIMGINDDSTLGGVQAYDALGYDMSTLIAWGYGLEGVAAKNELINPDSPYKGSLAMFPEYFGRLTVLAGRDLFEGVALPEWIAPPITLVTIDNLFDYYEQDGSDWNILWPAVEALGWDGKDLP